MKFDSFFAMIDFLRVQDRKILLIIDEYPYLKQGIEVSGIGFICTGGFAYDDRQGFILIDGNDLYEDPE